jgi:uncharacterized membrane protein YjjP (DUF1212 family)
VGTLLPIGSRWSLSHASFSFAAAAICFAPLFHGNLFNSTATFIYPNDILCLLSYPLATISTPPIITMSPAIFSGE